MSAAAPKTNPPVLTFRALRRSVGLIAVLLPFALAIPWWVFSTHVLPTSISGYYYTGMRNLLVGSLCAIAMFNLCCRGYQRADEIAGFISAVCAFGVAFCPIKPACVSAGCPPKAVPPTPHQVHLGILHYIFAAVLFLTLSYFCLVLFRRHGDTVTRQKIWRNRVYFSCGVTILASIACILFFKWMKWELLFGPIGVVFFFETTSLLAFGCAWLVKGETIPMLNDRHVERASSIGSSRHPGTVQ